ncbi:MAG: hypothetical protein HQL51_04665 [Magnetococcales bacterium]|nr:hypothetical protein [Magnetococcales bacterium]
MKEVHIVDHTILLSKIDVEPWSDRREKVLEKFKEAISAGEINYYLPLSSIIVAGAIVASIENEGKRAEANRSFSYELETVLAGDSPWTYFGYRTDISPYLQGDFLKIIRKIRRDPDLELSSQLVIEEWRIAAQLHRQSRVKIFSLDPGMEKIDTAIMRP